MSKAYITKADFEEFSNLCQDLIKYVDNFDQLPANNEKNKELRNEMREFITTFKQWLKKYFSKPCDLTMERFAELVVNSKAQELFTLLYYYVGTYLAILFQIRTSDPKTGITSAIVAGKIVPKLSESTEITLSTFLENIGGLVEKMKTVSDANALEEFFKKDVTEIEVEATEFVEMKNTMQTEITALEEVIKNQEVDLKKILEKKGSDHENSLRHIRTLKFAILSKKTELSAKKKAYEDLKNMDSDLMKEHLGIASVMFGVEIEKAVQYLTLYFGDDFMQILYHLADLGMNMKMSVSNMINVYRMKKWEEPGIEHYLNLAFSVLSAITETKNFDFALQLLNSLEGVDSAEQVSKFVQGDKNDRKSMFGKRAILNLISCVASEIIFGRSKCGDKARKANTFPIIEKTETS